MNEPGPDGAVAGEAGALARSRSDKERGQQQVESSHHHAGRWWLASTAYPLAAVCDRIVGPPCEREMSDFSSREPLGLWLVRLAFVRCRNIGERYRLAVERKTFRIQNGMYPRG